ncbi:hypothetical protein [Phycicoccus avicenniae]|uniref:hypothetical protein n=1 Tax=Phycicoccus avicenniae TaxID=2828860 RepID=UPI003D298C7B
MRSPSSLIFLVLLGVWAAYFVQYWIRRRDHLATARSVEQFSAAMRVLERRQTIPRTDLSDPAPRSFSVHPARSARPQVVVKRAVPAEMPTPRTVSAPVVVHRGVPRRVRALALLTSLVGLVVTGVLALLSVLVPWAPLVALGAIVLSLGWVRSGVRAEQAARAAARRRAREMARRRASAPAAASVRRTAARPATASSAPATTEVAEPVEVVGRTEVEVEVAVEPAAPVAAEPVAPAAVVEPVVAAEVVPEPEPVIEYVHLVDEDDIPLTWDPVPVPRPTYTMKAKAERPEVAPAAVTPEPAAAPDVRSREDDLDQRRVAGA